MQTVLDAPDPHTRDGVRDRAMLHLTFAAGHAGTHLFQENLFCVTGLN